MKNNFRRVVGSLAFAVSTASLASPPQMPNSRNSGVPANPTPPSAIRPLLVGTPLGLPRCLQASNVFTRLQALQDIASLNDGNRAAGQPGYQASIDYVKTLQKAGYKVTVQPFPFTAYYPKGPGTLNAITPTPGSYVWETDFTYLSQSEAGDVSAPVVPVDVALGRATPPPAGARRRTSPTSPAVPSH